MSTSGIARSLVSFAPSPRRWPVAVQAALAVALPVVVTSLAGHSELGLQASLGAFTAVYAAALPRAHRLRALPVVALGLVGAVLFAALLAPWRAAALVGLIITGVVASLLTVVTRLGPPGPIMFVLVYGVADTLAAPTSAGGAGVDRGMLVLMVLTGCLTAYLIAAIVMAVPAVRWARADTPPFRMRWALDVDDRTTLLRLGIAIVAAALVAAWLGDGRPYWAVGAAVAVLSISGHRRVGVTRAMHRALGTVVGIGVFALLSQLGAQGVWLGLLLGALQFAVEMVVVRHYALALAGITPLVLLLVTSAHPDGARALVVERLVDTLLGVAVALVVLPLRWPGATARPTAGEAD